jgi:hypothetical protein
MALVSLQRVLKKRSRLRGMGSTAYLKPDSTTHNYTERHCVTLQPEEAQPAQGRGHHYIALRSASPVGEARCRCRKVWLTRIDYYYYCITIHAIQPEEAQSAEMRGHHTIPAGTPHNSITLQDITCSTQAVVGTGSRSQGAKQYGF